MLRFRYHTAEGIVDGTAESPEELDAFTLRDPGRAARGLGRRRHVRAQPRRARRGEHGQGPLHPRLRRRAARALPQGRRLPAHGRARASRSACAPTRRWDVPGARDRRRARRGRRARRPDDRQRRLLARRSRATNPLYLPQAKIFAGACALGPAVLVPDDWEAPLEIQHAHHSAPTAPSSSPARRRPRRCAARSPSSSSGSSATTRSRPGSVLLTGTGLVPPDDFTLEPGHMVEIRVPGIGTLTNPVVAAADLITANKERSPCLRSSRRRRARRSPTSSAASGGRARPARRTRSAARGARPRSIGEFPASGEDGRRRRGRGRRGRVPRVVAPPGRAARRDPDRAPPTRSSAASSRSRRT